MFKFTDEQKRELLTEYKELHKKSIEHITTLQKEQKISENIDLNYYAEKEKILNEVEHDLTKFDDEQWGYIFVFSLLYYSSIKDNENGFSNMSWTTILGLLAIFTGNPSLPHDELPN